MNLSDHQWVFLKDLVKLIKFAEEHPNYKLTGGELWRPKETADLYAARGIGSRNSLHLDRLAVDLNLFIDEQYKTDTESYTCLGAYWKSLDPQNRWGGDFTRPDGNHFSRSIGGRA